MNILIIDDSPSTLEFMTRHLEQAGFTVIPASSAERALEILENTLPDMITCDIKMPRMDGFEFARTIKSDTRFRCIPVVAVSNSAYPEDIKLSLDAGYDGHICKPLHPEEYPLLLRAYLK